MNAISPKIELTDQQLECVRAILRAHLPRKDVRVFGSRVNGRAKPHSDLDLALMDDAGLPELARVELLADFEDSDLPFRVDFLLWRDAPPRLQEIIAREGIRI